MVLLALIAAIGVLLFTVMLFCTWKFYQLLSKMNDNLVGIRRAVESASLLRL